MFDYGLFLVISLKRFFTWLLFLLFNILGFASNSSVGCCSWAF